MTPPSETSYSILPITLESFLVLLAVLVALGWPRLGFSSFSKVERAFRPLARRRWLAVTTVGLTGLLLRLAILPFCPVPIPFVPDDFSFLLSADTFADGRLANPTPAMWTHLESIHITMQPTYTSMYFPAQGLVLAAGRVLLGHPWFGQLLASALMCAAICWMLQAWIPATWAFLGGLLAVVHLGLFSYWINTYHAGALPALGGALVLGALPRLMKTAGFRHGLLLAIGIVILALSRPFEGLLLCLPVSFMLGRWVLFGKNKPAASLLMRRAAFPLALLIAAAAWLGYYDYRAFQSPFTLPYTIGRATYAMAPYFVWQSPRPEPAYRHPAMRHYYEETELKVSSRSRTLFSYFLSKLLTAATALQFFAGIALLPPLIMLRRVFKDRRIRFLLVCLVVLAAGIAIQVFLLPHYLAPFTAVFYAIGLQAMRHLRLWKLENRPFGLILVRLIVTVCVIMSGLRLFAGPLHFALPQYPAIAWNFVWYGPDHFGTERARVESDLMQFSGKQLVIVRYSNLHNPFNEWVYNSADIDSSKVLWAREMDAADNAELMQYYRDRKVWLVQPDTRPPIVSPYPLPPRPAAAAIHR
jgi:hypothetical protein